MKDVRALAERVWEETPEWIRGCVQLGNSVLQHSGDYPGATDRGISDGVRSLLSQRGSCPFPQAQRSPNAGAQRCLAVPTTRPV